jgi:hypothetical protein
MGRGLAAYASVFGVGYLGYMLLPSVLSAAAQRYELNETDVGLAATAQLLALAIALFATAPNLKRIGGRFAALLGGLCAIAGYAIAAIAPSFGVYVVGLVISGIGAGAAIAGGDAFVARSQNPPRLYAIIFAIGQLTAIIMLAAILPMLTEQIGLGAGYWLLAAWSLLMTGVAALGPDHAAAEGAVETEDWSLYFAAPVIGMFLLGVADAAVWPFSAEIGKSLGLADGDAELVLAAALAAGVVGAAIASVFSVIRSNWPVLLAGALLAASYVGVLAGGNIQIYAGSQISVLLFFGFIAPFILGLAGQLDSTGGMMAAASGAQMIGFGLSPWVAGLVMASFGPVTLAIAVAVSVIIIAPFYLSGKSKLRELSS